MELFGPNINIPQQDVVRDNILHEGRLIVLFLIVDLGPVQGDHRHRAHQGSLLILPFGKSGITELPVPPRQGLKGVPAADHSGVHIGSQGYRCGSPLLSNTGQLVAGDHRSLFINHTHRAVCTIFHLQHNALEDPAGHNIVLLSRRQANTPWLRLFSFLIIPGYLAEFNSFLKFFCLI